MLAGEAMIARVVRTLLAEPRIARIVILAQEPQEVVAGDLAWIGQHPAVHLAESGAGISHSIAAIAGGPAAPWPVLVTTADHPLLAPADVTAMIDGAKGADVAIGMVSQAVLLSAYPENRRTWLRFRGGAYTGANLFALTGPAVAPALALWAEAEQDRKAARKLVMRFGPWLALRALTRTISLEKALALAGRRIGLAAKPILIPRAEAGIDVDKPADYALASAIVSMASGSSAAT